MLCKNVYKVRCLERFPVWIEIIDTRINEMKYPEKNYFVVLKKGVKKDDRIGKQKIVTKNRRFHDESGSSEEVNFIW